MRLEEVERDNLREIAGLSQRGGTLSIVHLIEANTLTVEMAAYSLYIISHGASILTAAVPGNAGKTTLLACLLTFIPPGSRIITISSPSILDRLTDRPSEPQYMLIHEIGSGPWYAYLWGRDVAKAFKLIGPNRYLASCIHVDTIDQLYSVLTSEELGVDPVDLAKLDLVCFMHLEGNFLTGYRRRVAGMFEAVGDADRHEPLFRWERRGDRFVKSDDSSLIRRLARRLGKREDEVREGIERCREFLEDLCRGNVRDFRQVRAEVIRFLERGYEP